MSGVGSKVWVWFQEVAWYAILVRKGLWRLRRPFFQIGLGCVMSHHHTEARGALNIYVQIFVGKFKMEFMPSASFTKAYPVVQILPKSYEII